MSVISRIELYVKMDNKFPYLGTPESHSTDTRYVYVTSTRDLNAIIYLTLPGQYRKPERFIFHVSGVLTDNFRWSTQVLCAKADHVLLKWILTQLLESYNTQCASVSTNCSSDEVKNELCRQTIIHRNHSKRFHLLMRQSKLKWKTWR